MLIRNMGIYDRIVILLGNERNRDWMEECIIEKVGIICDETTWKKCFMRVCYEKESNEERCRTI